MHDAGELGRAWLPGARVRTMRSNVLVDAAMLPSGRPKLDLLDVVVRQQHGRLVNVEECPLQRV